MTPAQHDLLRQEAQRIIEAGVLGRSSSYARLLEYLVECAANSRTPKELEIAMEVFGKGLDFDSSTDSMVRVYAHNLRQKLETYYSKSGKGDVCRLTLPRGEYRIQLITNRPIVELPPEIPAPQPMAVLAATPIVAPVKPLRPAFIAVAVAVLLACGVALGLGVASLRAPAPSALQAVAASPLWAPLLDDDRPIQIVVGDYYIFGERDSQGGIERLVRDFGVNSSKDLDELMLYDAGSRNRYLDLDLTYLPAGTAFALRDVLRILHAVDKPVRVVSMSELSAADLKAGHVVYLGYISALGMLEEFVFSSSGLLVGMGYDELLNRATGEVYVSDAGIAATHRNYRDYAFISAFPGPGGNHFLVVTGTRDAGLMQAAQIVADPLFVRAIEELRPWSDIASEAPAFELLYEVTGYGRTNLDAMLVHSAPLSYRKIWGGNPLY